MAEKSGAEIDLRSGFFHPQHVNFITGFSAAFRRIFREKVSAEYPPQIRPVCSRPFCSETTPLKLTSDSCSPQVCTKLHATQWDELILSNS